MHRVIKQASKGVLASSSGEVSLMSTIKQKIKAANFLIPVGKLAAICNFCAVFPAIMAKAASPQNVIAGFITAGIITSPDNATPNLSKMIATCKADPLQVDVDLIRVHLASGITSVYEAGQPSEGQMAAWGFPMDKHADGSDAPRAYAGAHVEHRQRAKLIGHDHQLGPRIAKLQEALDAQEKQAAATASSVQGAWASMQLPSVRSTTQAGRGPAVRRS